MHHVALTDERVRRIIEVAADRPGAIVFVHCGVLTVGVRRKLGLASHFDLRLGNPIEVAKLALAFPKVPFIIPHFGAGLLRETLMAADTCANIYLDTSSSNSWTRYTPGLTLDAVFNAALAVVGASRLLFGTDSSFFPRGWQKGIYDTQRRIIEDSGVNTADASLIVGGNFDRLFEMR
jgi:predicted TIM-barrel fold metal-dependent hydrolase